MALLQEADEPNVDDFVDTRSLLFQSVFAQKRIDVYALLSYYTYISILI